MNQPVTELGQRFSDPDAVAAGWDDTRRVLEAAELSWICTVRPDGRPHLTPLVARHQGPGRHAVRRYGCWFGRRRQRAGQSGRGYAASATGPVSG